MFFKEEGMDTAGGRPDAPPLLMLYFGQKGAPFPGGYGILRTAGGGCGVAVIQVARYLTPQHRVTRDESIQDWV